MKYLMTCESNLAWDLAHVMMSNSGFADPARLTTPIPCDHDPIYMDIGDDGFESRAIPKGQPKCPTCGKGLIALTAASIER